MRHNLMFNNSLGISSLNKYLCMYLPYEKTVDCSINTFVKKSHSDIKQCLNYIDHKGRCQKSDEEANVKYCP